MRAHAHAAADTFERAQPANGGLVHLLNPVYAKTLCGRRTDRVALWIKLDVMAAPSCPKCIARAECHVKGRSDEI